MGLLSTADYVRMQSELADVRDDNALSITIRRGASTLAAQTVRIARAGTASGQRADVGTLEEAQQRVVVLGGITLDIRPGDRFNDLAGVLYEVVAVRPNRRAAIMAEAKVIQ